MSQEDGKSDFFSLDPPLTLSPPKSSPAKKPEAQSVVVPQPSPEPVILPVAPIAPIAPITPIVAPTPVQPAPAPQAPAATAPAPVAPTPAAAAPVADEDDVIIIDDDGEPAPAPAPQSAAPQAAPAPAAAPAEPTAPAEPPAPPTFDELAAITTHADLADAMSQVAASPTPPPSPSSVLRQARPQRSPSALKKNVVPVIFTLGSILILIGGWAIMAHNGIVSKLGEEATEQARESLALRVKIGFASIPVGILLLLAATRWSIQIYSHKPEPAPKKR